VKLRLHEGGGDVRDVEVDVHTLIIAGMTGRDAAAVQEHIDELVAIGIAPPKSVPIYYRVSASLLSQADRIQVVGGDSSGEVEAVLIGSDMGLLVTVGSDHTDRNVEAYSVNVSKQMCSKVIGGDAWRYADVAATWDDIELITDRVDGGEATSYQRGRMAAVRTPENLIGGYFDGATDLPPGVVMFTGTVPALGEIAHAERFEIALIDPNRGRSLKHAYDVDALTMVE
jgi:hypothetical protein